MQALAVDSDFWRGRRVLVTGHTGFKGSWLVVWLSLLGAKVTGLALAPRGGTSLFVRGDVGRRVRSIIGDVREPATVGSVVAAAEPEVVLHLAAQPLVLESLADPVGTFATNLMGTIHLLEAVRLRAVGASHRRRDQRQVLPRRGGQVRRRRPLGRGGPVQRQQGLR